MDINNPTANLNLNDQSKIDDSIKQEGVTIHADNGSVVNTNSGNGRTGGLTRMWAMLITICFSLTCDFILGYVIWNGQQAYRREFQSETRRLEVQSREGSQWILRQDMLKAMEHHEATKQITEKQYKALRDEFDYYTSIGGNHDAKERLNAFTAKILSGDVKVVK